MINSVGVLGAGQMGSGIAHVFAQKGYGVTLFDLSQSQLDRARSSIGQNLERQAKKGTIEESAIGDTLQRISATLDISGLSGCDFFIEAVTENEAVKLEIFKTLDETARPDAILASNTSSIPITKIASATRRPEKVIGMHFMNPVPIMQLVEVIRGVATSDETFTTTASLVASIGKEMAVSQDYPGFIVNRVLIPMLNEAIFALHEGIATAEDIDKGMKLGTNQPMGPLALADFIGLDTVLAIATVLYDGFKDPKYRPCPLLVKMVQAGQLGKKSGRGFYIY
ncbi:3-hydroxybutyryl-CoA dehydrogenase [Geomonas sp. RF6]|uniref:3-hydroxybutyryl-CoA dehydrogenase n=1 Tax=Geomonas sp. RF6 TaxID=2897342 RepID=UPI001E65BBB4|nr:3-hydroxybutyryl-CoA dehydrogenase [Geomonas sp. RF6]UFS70739.1 3-hydroxybutyryl-CoA dehydrogenase [Geomonas sp. RF6]